MFEITFLQGNMTNKIVYLLTYNKLEFNLGE